MFKTKWVSFLRWLCETWGWDTVSQMMASCHAGILHFRNPGRLQILLFWLRGAIARDGAQFPYLQNIGVLGNNFVTWVRTHTWYFLRKWLVWISTQKRFLRTLTLRGCYCFNFGRGPSLWDRWDGISLVVSHQLLINILLGILNQRATWSFDAKGFTLHRHSHTIRDYLATRHFYLSHVSGPEASPLAVLLSSPLSLYCAACCLFMFSFSVSSYQLDTSRQLESILKAPFGSGGGWAETTLFQSHILLRLSHFLFRFPET